jgi:hypothetical protein
LAVVPLEVPEYSNNDNDDDNNRLLIKLVNIFEYKRNFYSENGLRILYCNMCALAGKENCDQLLFTADLLFLPSVYCCYGRAALIYLICI